MLGELNNDVLEVVARRLADPDRQVDDVARDAAALALVGDPCAGFLSAALWKRVAGMAAVLDPSAVAQALASGCTRRLYLRRHLVALARSSGVDDSPPMAEIEDEIRYSDDPVHAVHCPIPRAAALYVLSMSFRWMDASKAAIAFPGRDLGHCELAHSSYRLSDLRRAPKLDAPDAREGRAASLRELDARYGGARPWWVRCDDDAALHDRRAVVKARGLPSVCAHWPPEDVETFPKLCKALGVPVAFFTTPKTLTPPVHSLWRSTIWHVPSLYRLSPGVVPFGPMRTEMTEERVREVVALGKALRTTLGEFSREAVHRAQIYVYNRATPRMTVGTVTDVVRAFEMGVDPGFATMRMPVESWQRASALAVVLDVDVDDCETVDAFWHEVGAVAREVVMPPVFAKCVAPEISGRELTVEALSAFAAKVAAAASVVKAFGAGVEAWVRANVTPFTIGVDEFVERARAKSAQYCGT